MNVSRAARLPVDITGTWDFKWPAGQTIRAAFQRPPDGDGADFEAARRKILSIAQLWSRPGVGQTPGIAPADADLVFDPPTLAQRGRQNRSRVQAGSGRRYEVLISLQRLPLERVDPLLELAHGAARPELAERITHPQSELGTYALRADDGAPTMYLGPMSWHRGSLSDYYDHPLVRFMLIHEFGHVLGLPHEHQSPKYRRHARPIYKSEGQIFEIVNRRLGLALGYDPKARDFVRADILRQWPGSERFSDWREYRANDTLDSVMSYPFHDCLLQNAHHRDCRPEGCPAFEATLERYRAPTPSDRAQLAAMYERKSA